MPVVGFNHNVRHQDRVFHVQTEDSGLPHAHYITHLFAGGNIVNSMKTSYADQLDAPELATIVRKLMEAQHKKMLKRLVSGEFNSLIGGLSATHYEPGVLASGELVQSTVNVQATAPMSAADAAGPPSVLPPPPAPPRPPPAAPLQARPPVLAPPGPSPAPSPLAKAPPAAPAKPPPQPSAKSPPVMVPVVPRPVVPPPVAAPRPNTAPLSRPIPPPRPPPAPQQPVWSAAPPGVSAPQRQPGAALPPTTRAPAPTGRPVGLPPRLAPVSKPIPTPGYSPMAPPAASRAPGPRAHAPVAGAVPNIFADDSRPVEAPHDDLPTLFAEELISEKSLDEVILAFLSADLEPPK